MAVPAPSPCPIAASFDAARQEFLRDFPNKHFVQAFSQFTSIDDVYNATEKIQKKQEESRALQNLAKIQPYLGCLEQYAAVLDTVVQVKPEILSLIWVSSTYMKSFAKVLDAMAQLGAALPHFKAYANLFAQNKPIQRMLGLFFRDILDFHSTALKFFRMKHWRLFFESFWPKYSGKFQVILNSIAQHRNMMDKEVTLAHITDAYAARVSAHEKFERDLEHWERMEFQNIMNSLSPRFYDAQIERIRKRCVVHSGKWLEQDNDFLEWEDTSNHSARMLWLMGIPGAGKTFLSSIIVNRLQIKPGAKAVAFAFLSHESFDENLTLRTLHSLLFQLIDHRKALRPILLSAYENNHRKLMNSSEFVEDLLKDLLSYWPTTYFIVDGVDEVAETERQYLLRSLIKLQESQNLKILISSRRESDIALILASRYKGIQVHRNNSKAIADYVDQRSNDWLPALDLGLGCEDISRLQNLIKKIAPKSKGMFLYARLVCDSLARLSDLDDIEAEVNNLPDGLNEAYDRILRRISQDLSSFEQGQARAILEWVSCSIVPITQKEVQIALSVARGKDPFRGSKELLLDAVRRCGPIIEVVNDNIYFVHFSAKEQVLPTEEYKKFYLLICRYLFSSQSNQYLKASDINHAIASTCLTYLSSDCFHPELSDEAIKGGIMRGAYVLLDYAVSYWLQHILRGSTNDMKNKCLGQVSDKVESMITLRRNWKCEGSEGKHAPVVGLKSFEEKAPEVYETLVHVHSFLRRRWRELSLADGDSWVNDDPLTLSETQWRVHRLFEATLCRSSVHQQDCKCFEMKRRYGLRLFKCNRLGCPFRRNGFETKSERDRHLRSHDRPYKCHWPNCDFSEMGFGSQARLNVHMQLHEKQVGIHVAPLAEDENEDDSELILIDAIKADDLELVFDFRADVPRLLEKHFQQARMDEDYDRRKNVTVMLTKLLKACSREMLEVLLEACNSEKINEWNILAYAVQADNLEAARILLDHGASVNSSVRYSHSSYSERQCMYLAIGNQSPEMIKVLLPYQPIEDPKLQKKMQYSMPIYSMIPHELPKSLPNPNKEERVIQCLTLLRTWTTDKNAFENCFVVNGERGCSIAIAEYLLRIGVNINARRGNIATGYTALLNASGKKGQEAAELMKFLLERGADPSMRPSTRHNLIQYRPGPQNISQWLGISWEQLVEESQKKYAASLKNGGDLDE